VVHVAKVLLGPGADVRDAPPVQLADRVGEGTGGVPENHLPLLERVERLDVALGEPAAEDLILDRFHLALEQVESREIAVDDGVQEAVEHEARAVPQQLGLFLAARAHVGVAAFDSPADRQDVVRAGEDVDFAYLEFLPPSSIGWRTTKTESP